MSKDSMQKIKAKALSQIKAQLKKVEATCFAHYINKND